MTEGLLVSRRPLVLHGERLICDPAWRADLAALNDSTGGDWSTVSIGELVAQSATAKCFRIVLPGQTETANCVYFKRDSYRLRRRLRYLLRPSRNAVEAFACGRLHQLDIPAPELVAVAERRRFGMPTATLIVTREIPGTMNLYRFLRDIWMLLPRAERRVLAGKLSAVLVEQLRTAHAHGFFHQDLKFRNLLVSLNSPDPELYWIDAPRARVRRWRKRRGMILDLSALARVAISVTSSFERMRFLRRYLGPTAAPGDAARLYRQVARHLRRRPPRLLQLDFPEGRDGH